MIKLFLFSIALIFITTRKGDKMTDNNKIYFNDIVQDFEITSRFGERVDPIWKKDFIEKNGIAEYNKLEKTVFGGAA